jgi:hypothetical protein
VAAGLMLHPVRLRPDTAPHIDDLRTLVTVTRTAPGDLELREVIVRLDRGPRIVLMYGGEFTLEVPPGRHRLFAHNTLVWRTLEFAVEPGEHLEFAILNWRGRFLTSLLGFIPAPARLRVEKRALR